MKKYQLLQTENDKNVLLTEVHYNNLDENVEK